MPPQRSPVALEFSFYKRFLFLGRNSGIHGLGHLFRENASFFARLFWFLVLIASLGCLYLLLAPAVLRSTDVSYTVDTRYVHWTTVVPAVTVCEKYNARAVQPRLVKAFPDLLKGQEYGFLRHLTDLTFSMALSCRKDDCSPCGKKMPCDVNWRRFIAHAHLNCSELIGNCSINGKEFSCCESFYMVDSEHGPCYSFNTLQTEDKRKEPLVYVNRSTGPSTLTFRVMVDSKISVHSPEELSTHTLDTLLTFDASSKQSVEYLYSMVEFYNDPNFRNEDKIYRDCRYLHEVPEEEFHAYPVYSYGACKLAESTEHDFKHCGCIHPARSMSYKEKYCNFTGLSCLVELEIQKMKGSDKDDDEDDACLASCVESELTTIHVSSAKRIPAGLVKIQMSSLPTIRYERNLLHSQLDLTVSVGGIVGLFFGASIFSLVEIFYLFLRS